MALSFLINRRIVPHLGDLTPGSLAEVGRGEEEVAQPASLLLGVGLDVRRGPGPVAGPGPPVVEHGPQPRLLGRRLPGVGQAASPRPALARLHHVLHTGVDQPHGPRAQAGAKLALQPRLWRGAQGADGGGLGGEGPGPGRGVEAPEQPGYGPVAPQVAAALFVAAWHAGHEGHLNAGHVGPFHCCYVLVEGRHLVVSQVPQEGCLEPSGRLSSGSRSQTGTEGGDPQTLGPGEIGNGKIWVLLVYNCLFTSSRIFVICRFS